MKQYRYLTKSRFKLASECPTKLYYTGKKEYLNQKYEDSFLLALAEGGFQVGELAKLYFPGGHDITTLDYDEAVQQTNDLLSKEKAVIYEAAIQTGDLFIRADILLKTGNQLHLIEVKSKSFDKTEDDPFHNKDGSIKSPWKPYLYDVAFQKHVIEQAFPSYRVSSYLMLADKTALCPTDGLNQKFRIVMGKDGRKSVAVSPKISKDDLSTKLLCRVNGDTVCEEIFTTPLTSSKGEISLTLPYCCFTAVFNVTRISFPATTSLLLKTETTMKASITGRVTVTAGVTADFPKFNDFHNKFSERTSGSLLNPSKTEEDCWHSQSLKRCIHFIIL